MVGQETETKFEVTYIKVTDKTIRCDHLMPKYFKPLQLLKFHHTENYA
jgi:hypothetical protein